MLNTRVRILVLDASLGMWNKAAVMTDQQNAVLLCSAFTPEISVIMSQLEMSCDDVAHGRINDVPVIATPVGIGLIDAARGITCMLERYGHIERVFFLGTAGSSRAEHAGIGSIVEATSFALSDPNALRGTSYLPELMASQIGSDVDERQLCLCPLGITRCDSLAQELRDHHGPFVENLECYSIARACAERNIPFRAFLGISNIVGANSHREWMANNAAVSVAVQEHAMQVIAA